MYDGISGLIFPPYKSGAVIFVVNSCRFCSQSINANKSLLPPFNLPIDRKCSSKYLDFLLRFKNRKMVIRYYRHSGSWMVGGLMRRESIGNLPKTKKDDCPWKKEMLFGRVSRLSRWRWNRHTWRWGSCISCCTHTPHIGLNSVHASTVEKGLIALLIRT